MVHRDGVERPLGELGFLESSDEDRELAALTGHLGGLRIYLDSRHAPPDIPYLSEIGPVSAADLQKASFPMPGGEKEHIEAEGRAATEKGDDA
jgi:hypothetical protein